MSVASDTAMRSALEVVAAAAGLQLGRPVDAAAVSALAGPFITREVVGPDGTMALCVAVRDIPGSDSDALCLALTGAAAEGVTGAEAPPVGSGDELVARFGGPIEAVTVTDGAEVQAVVITAVERRGPGPVGAAGLPGVDPSGRAVGGFDKLVNVALDVSVELGRTRVTLSEVLEFDVGSVVELDRAAGAPVDIRVNGTLLAQGEVVLIDDEYAVRITAIVDPGHEG